MRLLLDTHVFLWCIKDDRRFSKKARAKVLNASEVFISSASIWEATIKIQLKKLEADIHELIASISESGFVELPITAEHTSKVGHLPLIHRDPFDPIDTRKLRPLGCG